MKRPPLVLALLVLAWSGVTRPGMAAVHGSGRPVQDQVVDYMNSLNTLEAGFIQTQPDGGVVEGTLFFQAPCRIRMNYERFVLLVPDDTTLVHYDIATGRKAFYPFRETPLDLFVRRPFVLDGTVDVLEAREEGGILHLVLARHGAHAQGQLALTFTLSPLRLRGWSVLDAQQNTTSVALVNIQENRPLDAGLFRLPRLRGRKA